jgi:deoxyribonuclease IV
MAGQGQQLCRRVEDLVPYLDGLGWHPRAAVCLDTCHLFAAGHDLAADGGVAATMDMLAATLGRRAARPGARERLDGLVRLVPGPASKHR